MSSRTARRRIDWDVLQHGQPHPTVPTETPAPAFVALTVDVMKAPSPETLACVLRHAVEFGRDVIGLERTGLYLLDEKNHEMCGTFGTDALLQTVDEHALTYKYGGVDHEIFSRAEQGSPWTIFEDCPQIALQDGKIRILGHGWVAGTAIRGQHGPLGVFYNDTALSHTPVDESKQMHTALLCALLGRVIEPCRGFLTKTGNTPHARRGIMQGVTELLARDPSLSCGALASDLNLSPRQLTQAFKRETNTSLVDYRNELRLARFFERLESAGNNLLEAALDAGFGSYAQFHRVFRARYGQSPREHLLGSRR